MKKLTFYAIPVFMLLSFAPMQLGAVTSSDPVATTATKTAETAKAETLTARLDEIKAIDKSNLSSSEKKQLRKEVRSIKGELKELASGGVYLSIGAILIIVLLLILLL